MNKRLYYLAHPYNGDKHRNLIDNENIAYEIAMENINFLSPLQIIPKITDDENKAVKKCFKLFQVCDGLILSGDWRNSAGCNEEIMWAQTLGKPIYIYKNKKLIDFS